jgi:hypothetical protein
MTVEVKRLSVERDPSPSTRAGANPNPGLTLALVCTESPTASREGTAQPTLHPEGGRNAQGTDPRSQAVGPP